MLSLLSASVLFSGSPTHTRASPNLRRKAAGKGEEIATEGDGDVEMLCGDENQLRKIDFTRRYVFLSFGAIIFFHVIFYLKR